MSKLTYAIAAVLLSCPWAAAQKTYPLWKDGAPGALGTETKDVPTLTVHFPKKKSARMPAVLVCPGGGYKHLSSIGPLLDFFGKSGFVVGHLRYRLPVNGYPHPTPLGDAQRAMRYLREHAQAWSLDPKRIGVAGFSSGGHLASCLATHHDAGRKSKGADAIDRSGCRPDFMVLFCPVISMVRHQHNPSVRRLLGKNPSKKLLESMSSELQVDKLTPPSFLAHARDDGLVKPENSIMFRDAMKKRGVEVKLELFDKGGHGFFQRDRAWRPKLLAWLRGRKILSK